MTALDLSDPVNVEWLHRLRNEVNSVQMAVATALVQLERGDNATALDCLARAASACDRARLLLIDPPQDSA